MMNSSRAGIGEERFTSVSRSTACCPIVPSRRFLMEYRCWVDRWTYNDARPMVSRLGFEILILETGRQFGQVLARRSEAR
jgi:hypothetical protein